MDVHRIGGGWDDSLAPDLYGDFVDACARRAGRTPRILLVVMGTDAASLTYHASLEGAYARIRALAGAGMPYAGSSAGAAVGAPTRSSAAGASTACRSARRTATRTSTRRPWSRASAWFAARWTCTPPS